ncbi:MAG: hypothetical protein LBR73_02270 [Oscillospiraceae bacterium]|jgi:hypothetical protein|nr:hypothetical protein [Oscillospiraceae bacterium]
MEKHFFKRFYELDYDPVLYNYDIYPKVIPAGRETTVTIAPRMVNKAFTAGKEYDIELCPFDEGAPGTFLDRAGKNDIHLRTVATEEGKLVFSFAFFGEQEYYLRVREPERLGEREMLEISVFVIGEDLVGRYPYKGDLHMHTCRSDGRQSPAVVAANYARTGYDFTVISDHGQYAPSLEAIAAYKDVPLEFSIIPGEEVHLFSEPQTGHMNTVHIINFGGEYSINALVKPAEKLEEIKANPQLRAIIPNPPDPKSHEAHQAEVDASIPALGIPDGVEKYMYADCKWIFDEIRKANGLGIFCHPYWISNRLQIPPSFVDYMMQQHPFDAFEVLGGELYFEQNGFQTIQYYEDRAKGRDYAVVGASDSHSSVNNGASAHCACTIVFCPENERSSLIAGIKEKYSVACDYICNRPSYVGQLRLVRYAYWLEKNWFPLHDDLCFELGRAMRAYSEGDPDAQPLLDLIYGRIRIAREKYFGF